MMFAAKFFLLCVAHVLCDFPLQGDFLARGKNHRHPIPGTPWYQCLFAHALIHAGAVFLITRSLWMCAAEFVLHGLIDYLKSDERLSFNQDQAAHYLCKVIYAAL